MSDPSYTRRLRPWGLAVLVLRGVSYLLSHWWLLVIAAVLVSPVGPHLRVQYTYIDRGGYRAKLSCTYLGVRGLVERPGGRCPMLVLMLDSRVRPPPPKLPGSTVVT